MEKKIKENPKKIAKLVLAQARLGIKAALAGDSLGRVAAGVNIQKNLKALALAK